MPLVVRNVSLAWDEPEENLGGRVARVLRVPAGDVRACRVLQRALDARDRADIRRIYRVLVTLDRDEARVLHRGRPGQVTRFVDDKPPPLEPGAAPLAHRPVVIGSGPAGLFAALLLAEHGYRPVVLERGQDAPLRHRARHLFYTTGQFDPENNLLFGIGGAGAYSDGKLYTRTHNPRNALVLEAFVRFGADPDILVNTKPHIGSDRLPGIVRKMAKHIVALGGEVRFGAQVVDVELAEASGPAAGEAQRQLTGLRLATGERVPAEVCILAIGYSARDTYRVLAARGVELVAKPFQMGVRIEHPQELISRRQYGTAAAHLPPADYHLVAKVRVSPPEAAPGAEVGATDLWSFCMCPGGMIVPSNESPGEICTNGASNAKRNSPYANSGLVVTIGPEAFGNDPLQGLDYQRQWERRAFELSGSYAVPAQRASDFLAQRPSAGPLTVSYPLGSSPVRLEEMLPAVVVAALHRGLPLLDRMIRGYASAEGVITAPETRASSPVRIPRDEASRESRRVGGLYPVGEGAGYAGGIMSSATDGIQSAEAVIARYAPPR